MKQALDLWIERERRREELLASIDVAEAEVSRGETIALTKAGIRDMIDDVKRRGRDRAASGDRAKR